MLFVLLFWFFAVMAIFTSLNYSPSNCEAEYMS